MQGGQIPYLCSMLKSSKNILTTGLCLVMALTSGLAQTADQWFAMGYEKYEQHDYTGAISDYTECIMLAPDYPEAYYNRGL